MIKEDKRYIIAVSQAGQFRFFNGSTAKVEEFSEYYHSAFRYGDKMNAVQFAESLKMPTKDFKVHILTEVAYK